MRLNNKPPKQNKKTVVDNDFATGFEDGKFDRFKPVLKVLIVIILLMGTAWGVSAYFISTDTKNDTNKNYTPDAIQQAEDISTEDQEIETANDEMDDSIQRSGNPTQSNSVTQQSSNGSSTPITKPYDPSKCEPLDSEAASLRVIAGQKKVTFDSTFAKRKNYGDIYNQVRSEYGNSSTMYEVVKAEADRRYNAQEAQINQLQTEWQDALDKGNTAYGKYQECRAKL